MTKNTTDINNLINNAVDASIDFEELMDSIDFNSYLFEDQEVDSVKQTVKYRTYRKRSEKALALCNKITTKIPEEIKKDDFTPGDKDERAQYFVCHLFKAKIERLEGRKQIKRKKEEEKYIDATHRLHRTFDQIPLNEFKKNIKGKGLNDFYNWAKVLYFNELAICYSGLAKSSMSLGYAEQSIALLEKLYPKLTNLEDLETEGFGVFKDKVKEKEKFLSPSDIIKLYTFALYNKGEAERLLREDDSALSTFRRIIRIYEKSTEKGFVPSFSDYNSALLRKALMFIDQGRGKEAIICLSRTEFDRLDYRVQDCYLEKASALIDQKKYEEAWDLLEKFRSKSWNNTFAQRKAKVYVLRLLNEFRKNKPEEFQVTDKLTESAAWEKMGDFSGVRYDKEARDMTITLVLTPEDKGKIVAIIDKDNKDIIEELWRKLHSDNEASNAIKSIKEEYPKFEEKAQEILTNASDRRDGDSFKKTCTNLAEYYQSAEENLEKALKCFYLYLLEDRMFSDNFGDIIQDWLGDESLDNLLQKYKRYSLNGELERIEDERYLKVFFDVYVHDDSLKLRTEKLRDNRTIQRKTVEILKKWLVYIYLQKDKAIELERIERKYERFLEKIAIKKTTPAKGEPGRFIENFFFKNIAEGMRAESIIDQMKRNTSKFIRNVVGTSKIHNVGKEEIQGKLSVLRRWNSFTPTLSSSINQSKGGGYFLHFSYDNESLGIVIDPGYDFLENFFSQGFKIGDIDLVLVSHAHPDHTDNLASILSLFHEMNDRLGELCHYKKKTNKTTLKKTLTLILSPGVFEHYNRIIKSNEENLEDIIVVHAERGMLENPYVTSNDRITIEIHAFVTSHKDLSQFQSLGFRITARENGGRETKIGFTGDAKWDPEKWPNHIKDCDIICVHLGSIVNILDEKDFCNTFCTEYDKKCKDKEYSDKCRKSGFEYVNVTEAEPIEQTRKENHLYLAGLASLLNSLTQKDSKLKLGIISEFGEELKYGIRIDLYKKCAAWFASRESEEKKRSMCLPGDIGLEVDVFTGNVYCHCCKRFVERNKIFPTAYGKEEAICFVCKECKEVLSSYQIGEMLKDYCENGRRLQLVDELTIGV